MESTKIKERLHQYIESGDDRLLKMMYAIAREYNDEQPDEEYVFSPEELALFERRRMAYLNGESKAYSWEESKKMIIGKP